MFIVPNNYVAEPSAHVSDLRQKVVDSQYAEVSHSQSTQHRARPVPEVSHGIRKSLGNARTPQVCIPQQRTWKEDKILSALWSEIPRVKTGMWIPALMCSTDIEVRFFISGRTPTFHTFALSAEMGSSLEKMPLRIGIFSTLTN